MSNLTFTIDRIGFLDRQIAAIEVELAALKATMVEVGPGKYQGDTYAITVTEPSTREGYDKVAKAKIEELAREHLSSQYLTAHTVVTNVKPSVRVSVRKDIEIAVAA